jgi:hypothetical protein
LALGDSDHDSPPSVNVEICPSSDSVTVPSFVSVEESGDTHTFGCCPPNASVVLLDSDRERGRRIVRGEAQRRRARPLAPLRPPAPPHVVERGLRLRDRARATSTRSCSHFSFAAAPIEPPLVAARHATEASPPDVVAVRTYTASVSSESRTQPSVFHQLMSAG